MMSALPLWAVDNVSVRMTKLDGTVMEVPVETTRQNDTLTTLTIKKENIPNDVKWVDVISARPKKGDAGFWLCQRGITGTFSQDNGVYWVPSARVDLPYLGLKTDKETFIAIFEGVRHQDEIWVNAKNGNYEVFIRFFGNEKGFKFYEDIKFYFYTLPKDADYNEMAQTYRKHKFARDKKIIPLKKRFKKQPLLEQNSKSILLKMPFGRKTRTLSLSEHRRMDYTPENDPPVVATYTFAKGTELLQKIKNAGVDTAIVITEGWQDGGYGGRTPNVFPICKEAGGESELVKYVKAGQDIGFLIDAHVYYTDCYTCSKVYRHEMVCKLSNGHRKFSGAWAGGRAYQVCQKYAWENWIPKELETVSKRLGFKGGVLFDVYGATIPSACWDSEHPITRAEAGKYHKKIMAHARPLYGVVGQECMFDDNISTVDYALYSSVGFKNGVAKESDGSRYKNQLPYTIVPFVELVYHDIVISSPFRFNPEGVNSVMQGMFGSDEFIDHKLRLIEFCGRPICYETLEKNIPLIVASCKFFKEYRHLMAERMTHHTKLAEGVFKSDFGNGAYIIVNYNKEPFDFKGEKIPPKGYIVR